MHRLSFFLLLTALLLPNECIHSSVLVVWGYLGRALPCLMSSEAKISILASEWLGSLVARLSGVFFFPFSLGSNWFHLEAQRNNKELGQANKYIQRDSEGKMKTISALSHENQFSPFHTEVTFWVHGFPSKFCFARFLKSWHFRKIL